MKRNRTLSAIAILLVIVTGLLSRRFPDLFPAALGKYPGDALWAVMIFLGMGFLFPRLPTCYAGLAAFAFSCAVEFFQLYQALWIDDVRDTLPGRLILGRGFAWADIAAYAVGILLGCLAEILFARNRKTQ